MEFFTNVAHLFNLSSFSILFQLIKTSIHPNSLIVFFQQASLSDLSILRIYHRRKGIERIDAHYVSRNNGLQVTVCLMVSHERGNFMAETKKKKKKRRFEAILFRAEHAQLESSSAPSNRLLPRSPRGGI